MGVLQAGLLNQPSAQVIDGSLKFDKDKLNYLTRTPGSSGNRNNWTISCWIKRTKIGVANQRMFESGATAIRFGDDNFQWIDGASGNNGENTPAAKLRDNGGWYHLVFAWDSSFGVYGNRIYVNGVELPYNQTGGGNPSGNSDWNTGSQEHTIGRNGGNTSRYYDGMMSQCYFVDGQTLGPSYFGFTDPLTGTWRPKRLREGDTSLNDGTVWSSNSTNFTNPGQGFNGDTSDYAEVSSTAAKGTFTFPKTIQVRNSVTFRFNSGTSGNLFINDTAIAMQGTGAQVQTVSFNGPLNSISLQSGSQPVLWYFSVDGEILKDSAVYAAFGTNGFYLPMDGNSPIGQDKSGKGNNWTPVNFGGSAGVDQATGALPILEGPGGAVANVGVRTDAFANNLVVAMPLVSVTTDVSNHINSGTTAKTVSQTGSSSDIANSTEQSNFYGSSAKFNGNVARLEVSGGGGTDGDYDFGTGDFCMECWFYPTATVNTNNRLFCSRGNRENYQLMIGSNKYLQFDISKAGNSYTSANNVVALNKWQHFAATRESGTLRLFVNGVIVKEQASVTTDLDETTGIDIGYESGYSSYINGYMQDVRVYKGVAKYTENFIPASTDPDILPDTPSGVSGSSKLAKITNGAATFDGSGDYLSTPHAASTYEWWDTPFTLEYYVYPNAFGASANSATNMVGKSDPNSNPESWSFGAKANGTVEWYYWTGSIQRFTTTDTIPLKKWTHLAFTHDGSDNMKIFIDGKVAASGTISGTPAALNTSLPFNIGKNANGAFNGIISNLRLVRGTALYTANFTPPTAPLTNVTNTKLLCCKSNAQPGAGVVSPNISGVNNGIQWSSYLTVSDSFTASGRAAGFDGSTGTYSQPATNSSSITWAPSGGITYSTSVEVYTYQSNGVFTTVSDGVQSVSWTTLYQGWKTIASGGGTFTSTTLTSSNPSASDSRPTFAAVRVDGTILVDPISPYGDVAATIFNPFNTNINTFRGQETGYPTWNPLRVSSQTLSNNNMTTTGASGNVLGSMFTPTSGKFYWEVTAGSDYTMTGIQRENNYDMSYPGNSTGQIALYLNAAMGSGQLYEAGSITSSWGGGVTGDVIGVALDMDNNKVYFYNNGRGLGSGGIKGIPEAVDVPTGGGYTANCRSGSGAYDGPSTINFGQKPFKFQPPDGFQPLNAANVRPEKVIARPDKYVAVTAYTGDNTASKKIDNLLFSPDLVWVKDRELNFTHFLNDTVRGAGKILQSNVSTQQTDNSDTIAAFPSFDPNGFTVGTNSNWQMNGNNEPYVGWCWKAGGSKGTFNIDDEGYANASDVNMSVGDLNSSFYNTSETWSNGLSALSGSSLTNPPNGFNGDPDNYADSTNGWSLDLSGHTFGTGAHTIEVKSGGATSFSVLGPTGSGSLTDPGGGGAKVWTGTYTGEINSITSSASGASVYYVKIDGKILVNNGTSLSGLTQYPSIAATGCSVGTKQGFSIIKATGSNSGNSIAHRLGKVPKFVISKDIDNNREWYIYHGSLGADYRASFDDVTFTSDSGYFGSGMTDTIVTLKSGGSGGNNYNGANMIYYIWADVPGLQKFGKYTGNNAGAPNGPFVELGFRPALVAIKRVGTGNWIVYDIKRDTLNPLDGRLYWNTASSNVNNSGYNIDFLSNGFRITGGNNDNYNAGSDYVYAAWAEAPTVDLYGGQSNAR